MPELVDPHHQSPPRPGFAFRIRQVCAARSPGGTRIAAPSACHVWPEGSPRQLPHPPSAATNASWLLAHSKSSWLQIWSDLVHLSNQEAPKSGIETRSSGERRGLRRENLRELWNKEAPIPMNILITGIDNLSCKGSDTNVETLRQLGIDVRIGDVRDADTLAT